MSPTQTYQGHLARVEEELTLAKLDRYEAEVDELDIEGALAFFHRRSQLRWRRVSITRNVSVLQ